MRKFSAVLIVLTLLLIPSQTFAQVLLETPTPTTTRRDLLMQRKETLQQDRAEMKATMQQKRDEFKQKLQTIRDQRKKTLVENIDQKIQNINARRTTHMGQVLTKLSSILDRVASKAASVKEQGGDTTSSEAAITTAETAIITAENAVATQAAKTYVIEITDETSLRSNVGQVISQLTGDLRIVNQLVTEAKHKVVLAAREVSKIAVTNSASESTQ